MKKFTAFTLTMTLSLSLLAGTFMTVSAQPVSNFPSVPLNYMDSDSDWKAETDSTHTSPVAFQGTLSKADYAGGTKVTGGNSDDPISNAKEADDIYFKLENIPVESSEGNKDYYLDIFNVRQSPNINRFEMKKGEVIVISMDVASPDITKGYNKNLFNCESNASTTSGSGNKWSPSATVTTSGDFGSGKMEDNKWYNIAYEITGTDAKPTIKCFLDGVEVATQELAETYLGMVRTGVQASKTAVGGLTTAQRIYYDNVYTSNGEPYTMERYLANRDAAALNFNHFKGENTAKDAITSDLNLTNIAGMDENTVITWESSSPVIDAATGQVTPALVDTDVTLTATVTNNGKSNTKTFALKVSAKTATDEELQAAKTALQNLIDANEDKQQDNFTEDSFAEFTAAKDAAETALTKPDVTVTELVDAMNALTVAVDGLDTPTEVVSGVITNDAFTRYNDNNVNNGESIVVKQGMHPTSSTRRMGYIGVDMAEISLAAGKVVLKLYYQGGQGNQGQAINENALPISVYETSMFDETELIWNNRPDVGALITSTMCEELQNGAGWLTIDVTDYVWQEKANSADSTLWFAFTTADTDNISNSFYSKEASDSSLRPVFEAQNINLGRSKDVDLNAIDMQALINDADMDTITQDLDPLPTEGAEFGYAINWTSSRSDIIEPTTGKVTLPDETTPVTLTASITADGVVHKRDFNLTVKVFSDAEEAAKNLTFDTIKGANTSETAVTSNLSLVDTIDGEAVTWESSDEATIQSDGTVIRDALANAKDVTLTATVGTAPDTTTKEFNLRVYGDNYVVDNADATVPVEISDGLEISTEQTWRMVGYTHTENGRTGEYLVYKASEGFDFVVNTATADVSKSVTFATSADGVSYTPFTDVEEVTTDREIGINGGHHDRVYTSTASLPAGTRYLKVITPDVTSRWQHRVLSVEIFKKDNPELTFDTIKNRNYSADAVTGNLNLPTDNIVWTSDNEEILKSDGTLVNRPETDTPVTLTATITQDGVTTVKEYKLTVKAYEDGMTTADSPWDIPFVYYRSGSDQIVAMNNSRTIQQGSVLYSSIELANFTETSKDVKLGLAVYDSTGKLLDVKYETVTVDDITGTPQKKEISLTLSNETEGIYGGCTVKAFVWDSEKMFPICEEFASVTRAPEN